MAHTSLRHQSLPWLIFCLSFATTLLLWQHERDISVRELRNNFDFQVRETTTRIEQRMAAYEQMLRGVQGLFAASTEVSHDDFQTYIDALQLGSDFYGIQGIGFALIVPHATKTAHITNQRRHGYPAYQIMPGGDRPFYAPVMQIEPASIRNDQVIGWDPYAELEYHPAMERARDGGSSALTGKISQGEATLLMFFPLYKKGLPHESLEDRRRNIIGWTFARLRPKEMMASLYGEGSTSADLRIYDGVDINEQRLLYDASKARGSRSKPLVDSSELIETGGHTWLLSMRSSPNLEARYANNKSQLIILTGSGMSLLLALLAWQLLAGRRRAMALAREMTSELRESEARWKYALEGAGDGVWDWDVERDHFSLSPQMQSMLEVPTDIPIETLEDYFRRIHPDDLIMVRNNLETCLAGKTPSYTSEFRTQRSNGEWKWVLSRGKVVSRNAEGRALRMIGTLSDISAHKHMEEELRQLSNTDTLTGLPNRRYLLSRLDGEISRLQRLPEQPLAVLMLDLDHFKWINDQFGHATGDMVLQHFATMIRHEIRKIDTVGRMGGEEFAIILPGADVNAAYAFAERLRLKTAQIPFIHNNKVIPVTVSIGVTAIDSPAANCQSALAWADKALYQAKESGRNQVAVYAQEKTLAQSEQRVVPNQQEDA